MKLVPLFTYDSGAWEDLSFELESFATLCLERTLRKTVTSLSTFEVSCLLTEDKAMQVLNQTYRGKDTSTNVLSFGHLTKPALLEEDSPQIPILLGDIVFAYETINIEALSQGKTFQDHFAHLLVHGLLHLLGYNHVDFQEALVMEALEKKILLSLGIADPYQQQGTPHLTQESLQ